MMCRRLLGVAAPRLYRSLGNRGSPRTYAYQFLVRNSLSTATKSATGEPSLSSPQNPHTAATTTHFGFEQVQVHEKEHRVRQVFENVAGSYDVMNDLMSGGLHRMWKDYFVDQSKVGVIVSNLARSSTSLPPFCILDVAGGTGDIAFRMVDASGGTTDAVSVTVCDINPEMLRVGEKRARTKYHASLLSKDEPVLRFMEGNAQALTKLENSSFDLYTIAFGLRNVTDVDLALKEAHRVLRPGGRYMCLEFSQVPNEMMRAIYDAYSFQIIPAMGEVVANDRASYQYLVESIRQFSNQEELCRRMEKAGFENVRYSNLTGGIVAIHEGWKPL